ncbi:MAG TPA: F0F1 ATP synthase subunit A [Actinomycetota bacterium]|jgi:F-type H+-transporting ATPase subunit a|nr:F0F1 ATP synthase subunit A [Actinomycetota bacterium]
MLLAQGPGFHVPEVTHLFTFAPFFTFQVGGIEFRVTFITIVMFVLTGLVAALFLAAFRRPAVIPGPLQNAVEAGVDAVRENIVLPTIGPEGERYMPLLTSMFFFVFAMNFMEVVPVVQFPISSRMAIPFFFAALSYVVFNYIGIRRQGPINYFRNALIIPGVPKPILPLLIVIELFSTFIFRPVTLAVRLFANMMAGHVMLTIFFLASGYFLYRSDSLFLHILSPVPFALSIVLTGFEMFIGLIQAFIITILTAVYIEGALHAEH